MAERGDLEHYAADLPTAAQGIRQVEPAVRVEQELRLLDRRDLHRVLRRWVIGCELGAGDDTFLGHGEVCPLAEQVGGREEITRPRDAEDRKEEGKFGDYGGSVNGEVVFQDQGVERP